MSNELTREIIPEKSDFDKGCFLFILVNIDKNIDMYYFYILKVR